MSMKRIFALLLIFCFYTQSITSVYQTLPSFNSASADHHEEDGDSGSVTDDGESGDDNTDQAAEETYDTMFKQGEKTDSAGNLVFEQIVLMLVLFSVTSRVTFCLTKGKTVEALTKGTRKSFGCLGFSTALDIAGAISLVAGEIIQSVKIQKVLKEKLGELTGDQLEENTAEKLVDDFINGESNLEFTLSKVKEETENCAVDDQSTAGIEGDVCELQVRPLKLIRDILVAQRDAANMKMWIYGVFSVVSILNIVVESLGQLTLATEDTAIGVENKATFSCASAATAVGGVGSACLAPFSGYQGAKASSMASCGPLQFGTDPATVSTFFSSCVTADTIHLNTELAMIPTCTPCVPTLSARIAAVAAKKAFPFNEMALYIPGSSLTPGSFLTPYLESPPVERIFNIFFENAYARKKNNLDKLQIGRFWTSIIGAIGGIAPALILKNLLDEFVNTLIITPWKRIVWSTVEGLLVGINWKITKGIKEDMDEQIEKLDEYLKVLSSSLTPVEELGTDRLMIDNFGASNFEDQFIEDFNNTFAEESSPCPFGGDGRGGCKSAGAHMKGLDDYLGLSGVVAETTSNVGKYGDAFSNKKQLSKNALSLGRKINAAKGPLDKIRKKLLKKVNALEKSMGRKPTDFDKKAAEILSNVKREMQKVAASKGLALASIGDKKEKVAPVKKAKKKIAKAKKEEASPAEEANGFEFDFNKDKADVGLGDEEQAEIVDQMIDEADITKSGAKDLFKIITTRYFKSAYPTLVEEAK